MCVSSIGLIDAKSPLYGLATTYGLPASLFLLFLGVDLKSIARLGPYGRVAVFGRKFRDHAWDDVVVRDLSSVRRGHILDGIRRVVGLVDGRQVPIWSPLRKPWGRRMMFFLPMVVVDTIVPYVWMGLLVSVSTGQVAIDRW